MGFHFPLLPLLFTFLLIIILTLIFKRWNSPKNLPPSPWKLPFIGNLHQLLAVSLPHRAFHDLSRRYGPIMHLKLGQVDHIIISSPEAAREIFKTHDLNFASRPELIASTVISGNRGIGFAPYGSYWRQLRKISVLELLSVRRVKSFRAIRERENAALVTSIIDISKTNNSTVNLTEKLLLSSNTMTALAAFGTENKHGLRFLSETKKLIELGSGFSLADLYPSHGFLGRMLGTSGELKRIRRQLDVILDEIITEHQMGRKKSAGDGKEEEEDILDVLLRVKDQGDLDFPLSMSDIKCVALDLFIGGTETSATTLTWAMAELMRHPTVMEKAQGEVRQAMKYKGRVEEGDLEGLQYMKLVINETLRLHPPLPLLVPRVCGEECTVGGFEIPAGSRVLINAWAIARDPAYWDDAESFKPERFEGSLVDFIGESFHYLPFGGGRRVCPGINFGLANIEITLAQLLFHFDWQLPDGVVPEEVDMNEAFGATVSRKENLCLLATPRFPLPANASSD